MHYFLLVNENHTSSIDEAIETLEKLTIADFK
jgi:hypothetical protein